LIRAGTGGALLWHGVIHDISGQKSFEAQLEYQALHDPLTGLPNRALLTDRLDHAVRRAAREGRARLAVLFLDFDRFKVVNDTLGHAAGDQVLVEVGHRLQSELRASDTAARIGGDEFVVLLEEVAEPADAFRVAERIVAAVGAPLDLDGR